MKHISLLGSTGSIGTQALGVIRNNPGLQAAALAARRNIDLLEQQIREFRPPFAVVYEEESAKELKTRVADLNVRIGCGEEGLLEAASLETADMVIPAVTGIISIKPTITAIEAGKDVGLVNKEALVTAGHLIMPLARKKQIRVLPVDSEHSAIFQCLQHGGHSEIHRLIITASGGPFRGWTADRLKNVTAREALNHPNWSMGDKITIDSATLVNKGLEVCEAGWLFDLPLDQIDVVVQPQSVIHSMVEFCDGAVLAQLSSPDMRLPIQYALTYPDRGELIGERLDFRTLREITFEAPDTEVFRGLPLAYEAIRAGGSMPAVFNAANGSAVGEFLQGRIRFMEIYDLIERAMGQHHVMASPGLEDIFAIDAEVSAQIESWC